MPALTAKKIQHLIDQANRELKPCPCCGGKAEVETNDYVVIRAQCLNNACRIRVERWVFQPSYHIRWCINTVKRIWNRRVSKA